MNDRETNLERWLKKNFIQFVIFILFIFTILPILAPVLMNYGFQLPAKIIYWSYSNLCHQLPYRSWFLFGSQTYYPLDIRDSGSIIDFSEAFKYTGELESSRNIIGNEIRGFKIAICERDLAMYGSLFFVGFLFLISKRNIKQIPFWIWLLFGVISLAIDGLSQLISSITWFQTFFPLRESTPMLRTITGVLFGVFTGWYIFPAIESRIRK